MMTTGKSRLAIATIAFACGLAVCAMPTKEELVQAQKLVQDLTADDVRALNAGTKKAGEVAAAQLAMADEAETEAGKYLLLQGAFKLYARSADYDAAADALARMRKEIADLPPEVVVELVNGEMRRVAAEKAPKVLAIFRDAQRTIKCRKDLDAAENAVKARPGNAAAQRRLAECHAGLGDWAKALEVFAKIGDEAAKYELDPSSAKGYDALKAANYWWEYQAKDDEPFKVHAAVLYRKGLEDGSISGLRKTLAEKRVKQMESVLPAADDVAAANVSAAPRSGGQPKTKLLDLGGGVQMEMIYVAPGSFVMGRDDGRENRRPAHKVTLTKGYWLGKYEVTQKQWRHVMGRVTSNFKGDDLPVDTVSWDDCQRFITKVNASLGGDGVRLPTEAEWEYACLAGAAGDFGGTGSPDEMGWYKENCGGNTHPVGEKPANDWGFHDMHGNVYEWCSDWWGDYPHEDVSDPVGPSSGMYRVFRGGGWHDPKKYYTSTDRWREKPSFADKASGFRLCMSVDQDAPSGRAVSRGSGAPAASVKAPEANGERPKDMSLTLRGGVAMDFVGCPAGSFMMGKPGDADPKSATFEHKVTITRPFWMGKFPVTVEQWTSVMGRLNLSDAQKAMGPKMPVNIDRADVMTLALKLTRMNQNKLPKGYVIRLPSEAEWEYAVRANSTDPDDPYAWIRGGGRKFDGEWDKYRTSTKDILAFLKSKGIELSYNEEQKKRMARTGQPELPFWGKIFGCVGEHQPNAWGIHDVFHGQNVRETVLDTVSSSVQADFFRQDRREYFFKDGDSDPLNYAGERKIHVIMLNDGPKKHTIGHPGILFRLVIGPDLLKERGIK